MHPYFTLLGLHIPAYGAMLAAGVVVMLLLLRVTPKYRDIKRSDAYYCVIYAGVGALIGAKLLYLLVELPAIIQNPSLLLGMLAGGAVFYGGLIGGFAGGIHYARRYRLPALALGDVILPPLALGHALGRVGCFLAGCCYGAPHGGRFSVTYPEGGIAPAGVPLLPAQLMEAAFLVLLCAALLLILRATRERPGVVWGWYMVLYGAWRFSIEFFRADPRGGFAGLATSQWISLALLPAGMLLLYAGGAVGKKFRKVFAKR